jgi:hypothetical protein
VFLIKAILAQTMFARQSKSIVIGSLMLVKVGPLSKVAFREPIRSSYCPRIDFVAGSAGSSGGGSSGGSSGGSLW